MSKAYGRCLQVHADWEEVWEAAGEWEAQQGRVAAARRLLQRGLRVRPHSQRLHLALLRLELRLWARMRLRLPRPPVPPALADLLPRFLARLPRPASPTGAEREPEEGVEEEEEEKEKDEESDEPSSSHEMADDAEHGAEGSQGQRGGSESREEEQEEEEEDEEGEREDEGEEKEEEQQEAAKTAGGSGLAAFLSKLTVPCAVAVHAVRRGAGSPQARLELALALLQEACRAEEDAAAPTGPLQLQVLRAALPRLPAPLAARLLLRAVPESLRRDALAAFLRQAAEQQQQQQPQEAQQRALLEALSEECRGAEEAQQVAAWARERGLLPPALLLRLLRDEPQVHDALALLRQAAVTAGGSGEDLRMELLARAIEAPAPAEEMERLFAEALHALPSSPRLWGLWVDWASARPDAEALLCARMRACTGSALEALQGCLGRFLLGVWAAHGTEAARRVRAACLSAALPLPRSFFEAALRIDEEPDASLYEEAARKHGKQWPELWLEWVRQERRAGRFQAASRLVWRAHHELQQDLLPVFDDALLHIA